MTPDWCRRRLVARTGTRKPAGVQHGEIQHDRAKLRVSPKRVPGGRWAVAGVRDGWRHSNYSRKHTGRFFGPGDVVREGRQENRRSRDQLRPA
jgi:hypothetical protein